MNYLIWYSYIAIAYFTFFCIGAIAQYYYPTTNDKIYLSDEERKLRVMYNILNSGILSSILWIISIPLIIVQLVVYGIDAFKARGIKK